MSELQLDAPKEVDFRCPFCFTPGMGFVGDRIRLSLIDDEGTVVCPVSDCQNQFCRRRGKFNPLHHTIELDIKYLSQQHPETEADER